MVLSAYAFLARQLHKGKREVIAAGLLTAIPLALQLIACYFASWSSFETHSPIDPSLSGLEAREAHFTVDRFRNSALLLYIPLLIRLVVRTRQFLYARSIGFIIFEIIVPVLGMMTLTPALLAEAKAVPGGRR